MRWLRFDWIDLHAGVTLNSQAGAGHNIHNIRTLHRLNLRTPLNCIMRFRGDFNRNVSVGLAHDRHFERFGDTHEICCAIFGCMVWKWIGQLKDVLKFVHSVGVPKIPVQ